MDSQQNDSSVSELTLRSTDERVKQTTDPIVRQVEQLCALLVSRTELESTGNSETSGSKRHNTSASPSHNRLDTIYFAGTNNVMIFLIFEGMCGFFRAKTIPMFLVLKQI